VVHFGITEKIGNKTKEHRESAELKLFAILEKVPDLKLLFNRFTD